MSIKNHTQRMDSAITQLSGVGPKIAEKLSKIGIERIGDLLFHLPSRYEDRTRIHPVGSLIPGQKVMIQASVQHSAVTRGKRAMLLAVLADGTGQITLRLFNFFYNQRQMFAANPLLRCYGEVKAGSAGLEMIHPEFQRVTENTPVEEALTPVYPVTEGLGQAKLRSMTDSALAQKQAEELLPNSLLETLGFADLNQSLQYVHRPPPDADVSALSEGRHASQQRLAFEELLAHRICLRKLRQNTRKLTAAQLPNDDKRLNQWLSSLPFELTGAQQRVIKEIGSEIAQPHPSMRLIQGDVGSGKTVVAAALMLNCVAAGYQAALTAPTEILAEQHWHNLKAWFEPLGINIAWLSGKVKGKKRSEALEQLSSNADMIVGTHALMQESVSYRDLALIVVDEQHRFGVDQRLSLRDKGRDGNKVPHQIIMTATPIPRTLAMTAYADLDISVIDELPPGRKPVATVAISEERRQEVIDRVQRACQDQRQVYWVCTLIDESESLQAQAASDTAEQLTAALPHVRIGLIHGRLKADEKEQIMSEFKAGEIKVLVATTVIEVGVDVPNASLMIIENAERLGLSQLHQLRGRVGRGQQESSCVLLYRRPLSETAKKRLNVLRKTNDGFEIARKDLELRGPGEVLGTRQTGAVQFRIADLPRDKELLPQVAESAELLLSEHAESATRLIHRWVGDAVLYAQV